MSTQHRFSLLLLLGFSVAMSGCASAEIRQTVATPASVAFEYSHEVHGRAVISDMAQKYCAERGKDAQFRQSLVGRTQAYTEAFFDCVAR